MKTCFKCKIEKPRSEFYKHPRMADGLLGKCSECTRKDVAMNRVSRLTQYSDYEKRRYRTDEARRARLAGYCKTPEGKAAHAKALKNYAVNNKDAVRAKNAANNAVRDGKIKREPCRVCGVFPAHKHHPDYSKPLDVIWLCPQHHKDLHLSDLGKRNEHR